LIFPYRLSAVIEKHSISKIYSLGNIAYKSHIDQVVLLQNAFSTLEDYRVWKKFSVKDRIYLKLMQFSILKNLKYASKIIVQTQIQKTALQNRLKVEESKIHIVPNHINLSKIGVLNDENVVFNGSSLDLLFLSKYYPHKNFEILPEICYLIQERKLPIRITLTLDENSKVDNKVLKSLKPFSSIISNIGAVRYDKLSEVYARNHGIFLPTLLESFSGNYIEAMYFGKIIFTSDKDFAREVCGDYANYFNPFSPVEIVDLFQEFLENPMKANINKIFYKKHLEKLNILDSNFNNEIIYSSI
jgi:glycosyltransferase involved in cell wall biosynthesis